MRRSLIRGALAAAGLSLAAAAHAHVTFEASEAAAGATTKAVLRVPHGCGGQATRAVRVTIPPGIGDVKPMPKPGWTLRLVRGSEPGAALREIVWEGGELADEHYDEFVFRARPGAELAGQAVPFPVVQDCATASERWTGAAGDKHPAPVLRVTAPAAASVFRAGQVAVEQLWSRATPGGARVAAGYMRVVNGGAQPDRLVGGSFAAAGRVEIHEMQVGADNVMRMRPVEGGLEVKPGASVELKPGGYHAMFLDLQRPLKEGETLKGTLRFEKAGDVEVVYVVRGLAAQGAGEHSHH